MRRGRILSSAPIADKPKRVHPFDLKPVELAEIKKLFPEFLQSRKTSEHKLIGLEIGVLREALDNKLKLSTEMIEKIISKINRRSDGTVYWNEFLNSLTDEGNVREIVADAQLYGFGVKRFAKKQAYSLKADDKIAEYYIHKMAVVYFEQMPFVIAFTEDQKVKVYEADTFKQIQEIKFASDYGVAKQAGSKEREKSSEKQTTTQMIRTGSVPDNLSRQFSGFSSIENGQARLISIGPEKMLESIAELGPRRNSRRKIEIQKSNMLVQDNSPKPSFQKRLGLNPTDRL